MTYYIQLTPDIAGNFGSGVTKEAIIANLKNEGVSRPTDFHLLGLPTKTNSSNSSNNSNNSNNSSGRRSTSSSTSSNGGKVLFDGKLALLFGSDEKSRLQIGADLMKYLGDEIESFGMLVPKNKEWLACVTLIDTDGKSKPAFQVIALVGSDALDKAHVNWKVEKGPPQLWKTHADQPADSKMMRDIKSFTGLGWWK